MPENLQLADIPAAQPIPAAVAPTSMPSSGIQAVQQPRHQSRRTFLRRAEYGTDPLDGPRSHGTHEPETRKPGSRRKALLSCDSWIEERVRYAMPADRAEEIDTAEQTPRQEIWWQVTFSQDRRQPGRQEHSAGVANPLDDCPAPGNPVRDLVMTLQCWEMFTELQPWPSLAVSRRDFDRNTELNQRLQKWEAGEAHDLTGRVLGQQHIWHRNSESKKMQPQSEE